MNGCEFEQRFGSELMREINMSIDYYVYWKLYNLV